MPGVALLIEKPICATVEESRRLIKKIPDGLVVGVWAHRAVQPGSSPEIKKISPGSPRTSRVKTAKPGFFPGLSGSRSLET